MSVLERGVAEKWEREAEELRLSAALLKERADREECNTVAGLSLDDAALQLILARQKVPTYFELFNVLKHGQAARLNIVEFYYAMRRCSKVRMSGAHVVRRRNPP